MTQTSLVFHIIGIGILIQVMMELYAYGKKTRQRTNADEPQGN